MKKLLAFFLVIAGLSAFGQEARKTVPILISAQGKTVEAFLDSNNAKKTLTVTVQKDVNAKLVIMNANARNESEYDRSFSIVNEKDEDLKLNFMSRLIGSTHTMLNDFFKVATKGKTYKLYTIAIPKDPKVAATIRVRRILLCNIAVK